MVAVLGLLVGGSPVSAHTSFVVLDPADEVRDPVV
jgi:hypothetical protein